MKAKQKTKDAEQSKMAVLDENYKLSIVCTLT